MSSVSVVCWLKLVGMCEFVCDMCVVLGCVIVCVDVVVIVLC